MRKEHRFPVETPDGRQALVRDARASDAKPALEAIRRVVAERPRTLLIGEDEIWTPKQWREHRLVWCPDGAWLSAELEGRFAGLYAIHRGARRPERHKAEFGIWLTPEARGSGLAQKMLEAGEAWGREHGVRRIELAVFSNNERAIRLYRSAGYVEEGFRAKAFSLPEGELVDTLAMAKLL